MTTTVLLIFGLVYLGMILGGLPFLQLDRTGIGLLGAIAVIATEAVSVEQAARSIDLPTLLLLFAFMVVSAQMRLGGFYDWVTARLSALAVSPPTLLGMLIAVVALLSAVFSNDIVCLAVAPVLVDACMRRSLDPVPFLLGLACAANVGSAATLIGNPQNMLIGQTLQLSFAGYAAEAAVPVLAGLALTWAVIVVRVQGRWQLAGGATPEIRPGFGTQDLDRWQTVKGMMAALAILLAFLFAPWPREVVALTVAGVLLMSRQLHSSRMLGLVDWELLVLFMGLFVVNDALQRTGVPAQLVTDSAALGFHLDHPVPLFGATFVLSNLVSNVPAVMLLLPLAHHPLSGPLLALASTFAGNLFIVGSIANIIVVDAAKRRGIFIDWRQHARIGVPVTIATMAVTALYLWWRMHS
ncbi:anion transporter [Roseateles sp.]|uniref:anion transporter n=1 Tax=Roseateles sp. TaxID=1971397 RepID=UPI0025D3C4B9|nr:anion transporter [Roseateles sp.]MBV8034874.1 anion transporter [Roseateles sp.]